MIDKEKITSRILFMESIAKKYNLIEIENEMNNIMKFNEEYRVHILMVGGFSAGKSAILNKFIGKEVLAENQAPETDIATELYFSDNERIIANFLDGSKIKVESIDELEKRKIKNLEYYVNSENIKIKNDYILVDTPGFDSGIEQHNRALMQYIKEGTAFFLVVDCEKGTLTERDLKFIKEFINYDMNIAIIINKCDKKIESEIEKIKKHIKNILLAYFGEELPIICTSIYDDDIERKISNLIDGFNSQQLYEKNMTAILDDKSQKLINSLEIIISSASYDASDIEREISKREEVRKNLNLQLEQQKKRIRKDLNMKAKENIMSKVKSSLVENAEYLANSYKYSIEKFKENIIEIIRPILISEIEGYSSIVLDDFISQIDCCTLKEFKNDDNEFNQIINSISEKIKTLSENKNLSILSTNTQSDDGKNNSNNSLYKVITSILAITTTALNPILEVIIVFLPEIFKMFEKLFEVDKDKQLIENIKNKVIPSIISKLRVEVEKALIEVEKTMIENLSEEVEELLNVEKEALEIAIRKKEEIENNYNDYIKSIENDIENIRK